MDETDKKIGLSLSGGGYRATVYHLGTLKKLNELGVLDKIDIISTNSGGSITGAVYGLYCDDFNEFEILIRKGVKSSVIKGILTSWRFLLSFVLILTGFIAIIYFLWNDYQWISIILLMAFVLIFISFQFHLFPLSELNEKIYNTYFFKEKTLSDLSEDVNLVMNSTNLETGRLFTFSKRKMGDSSYDYPIDKGKPILFQQEKFPIARAVAASTSVPFVFTPVKISAKFFKNRKDLSRAHPRLIDGGIYDNQGIHKVTQDNSYYGSDIVIISDAGGRLKFKHKYRNTFALLLRTSNIFMNRIKNVQMIEQLYSKHKTDKREVAYQSLGWDLEDSIPDFIKGIKQHLIMDHVLKSHKITKSDISDKKWKEIENKLRKSIEYDKIIKKANSKTDLLIARNVKTNLVSLNDNQILALINHAALITEIQVKLYCPTIFN